MKKLLVSISLFTTIHSQSVTEVWNYAHSIGIKHDEIVVAQSVLETGWYKCESCSLDYNNLFGFKYKGEYLKFEHWKMSVIYYKDWQRKLYKGGDYYEFLKCIDFGNGCHTYAEDMNSYIQKLEEILFKIWSC